MAGRKQESELAIAEKVFQAAVKPYSGEKLGIAFGGLQTALKAEARRSELSPVDCLRCMAGYAVSASEAATAAGDDVTACDYQSRERAYSAAVDLLDSSPSTDSAPTDTSQKNVDQPKS